MDSQGSLEDRIDPIEQVKRQLNQSKLFVYDDRIAELSKSGPGYEQIIAYVKQRGFSVYVLLRAGSPIPSCIADANIRHVEYYEEGPKSEAIATGRLMNRIRSDELTSN